MGVQWGKHFKLGLAGHARPGPINPKEFTVNPVDGQSYKGQEQIKLRSDGAFLGLLLAPGFGLGPGWDLELPVVLGQGAYGFYLTDEDRETPDGGRVSVWENQLQDGKDSSVGFGVDGGVKLGYAPSSFMRLSAGLHYTKLFGYEAFALDNYDGPGASVALEFGAF